MQNFWANFIDFEPEIKLYNAKLKNLNIVMQDSSLYLGKANLMQKI